VRVLAPGEGGGTRWGCWKQGRNG